MRVNYNKYRNDYFTCSECGWTGKGEELIHGDFDEYNVIGDLECPKCFHLIAFWQGKEMK